MTHVTKYTNSLRAYAIAVLSIHYVALAWFYPDLAITIVCAPGMLYLLFVYCDLMYTIEDSNRKTLLKLIDSTDNEHTKNILTLELIYHDENSVFTNPRQTSMLGI